MPLATYAHFADRDPLTRVVLEQMLAGVSTRRFARTREPVGEDVVDAERSTSKSAVSARVRRPHRASTCAALMSRPLGDLRLAVLMLDGIELKGRCCVVALGITTDGIKVPLGLWDGSTENKTVTAHLLSDLVDRGLDVEQGVLVVLDGSKALRAAVNEVFGPVAGAALRPPQGTQRARSPARARPPGRQDAAAPRVGAATTTRSRSTACASLADELERTHPGAAASLREGLQETLTLTRLGIRGRLKRTLAAHEPDRVDDRDRPPHVSATSSAGNRATCACAGPPPACSKPSSSSARSSATATSPSSPIAVERDLAAQRAADHHHDPRGGRYARHRLTNHTGTAVTKFHDGRDNLAAAESYPSGNVGARPAMNTSPFIAALICGPCSVSSRATCAGWGRCRSG